MNILEDEGWCVGNRGKFSTMLPATEEYEENN